MGDTFSKEGHVLVIKTVWTNRGTGERWTRFWIFINGVEAFHGTPSTNQAEAEVLEWMHRETNLEPTVRNLDAAWPKIARGEITKRTINVHTKTDL
jgi:hypothetical protein